MLLICNFSAGDSPPRLEPLGRGQESPLEFLGLQALKARLEQLPPPQAQADFADLPRGGLELKEQLKAGLEARRQDR